MNEFLMQYGLWLVIALIVLITVVYLLSGRKSADIAPPVEPAAPVRDIAPPPVAATPPAPLAVMDPMPVTMPPLPEAVIGDAVVPSISVPIAPAMAASPAGDDNLLQLKGVGPKLAALLGELGVTSFAQIAEWTDSDLAAVDARLGNFKGRPVRDHWVDQAKYLAAGDVAGFEAKYGKL